jgi:hypothetical protein
VSKADIQQAGLGGPDFTPKDWPTCGHHTIVAYATVGEPPAVWACQDCALRFYPACRTCVDVGHRNVDHVPFSPKRSRAVSSDPRREAAVAALAPVLWDESSQREEAGPYEQISQEDRTLALNWTGTILDAILADPAKRAALLAAVSSTPAEKALAERWPNRSWRDASKDWS